MTLTALDDSSLIAVDGRFGIRIALPWIRSMPLWCLTNLTAAIDDAPAGVAIRIADRDLALEELATQESWWFLQDRLLLRTDQPADDEEHAVTVTFDVLVPYLQADGDSPLTLSFAASRRLQLTALPGVDAHTRRHDQ